MKLQSIIRTTLIVGAALLSTFSSYAQTQPAPTARPKMTQEERQQKRYDQVARDLDLTPDQKAKFEQTDKAYNEKMKSKRMASKEEISKMREERMNAHRALLTKEQVVKYDEMQAKRQQKQEGRKMQKGDKMKRKAGENGQKAPDNKSRNRE